LRPSAIEPVTHQQLQRHRHLTLQLAWEEYRQQHPEGYRYSYFCELYQQWQKRGRPKMSAAQRKAASARMKRYWAQRRKAANKSTGPKASKKAAKIARHEA
jgi:transposase